MQNKTSALAFLFVIFVVCLGACAAFSTLTRGRGGGIVAVESWTPTLEVGATSTASAPAPTELPVETPTPRSELTTPVAPTFTPIPPATPTSPPSPTPTPSATPTRSASESTPVPPSGPHQYYVIRNERDCNRGGIIGGWVYDTGGNGLPWANVRLYNDYGWSASKQSEGPPQVGKYEFTMGFDPGLFHVLVVDAAGQPLSAVIDVDYEPACSQRIDWQQAQ